MNNSEKTYIFLCILFSLIIVIGNLIYQKFVVLKIFSFHTFELSAGAVLYPLTYLVTDLITEFFGKEKACICVKFAILMNIITISIIELVSFLPASEWSKIDDKTFNQVFGSFNIAFLSSVIACYVSQAIDINLYLKISKLTKGKYIWLRNNVSSGISLAMDTFIVIGLLTIYGILPKEQMWTLIGNSYSFKLFFIIFSTPLFYCWIKIIKIFIKDEYSFKNQDHCNI